MKVLRYCTGWMMHENTIQDDAKADAAYAAMTEAMASYDKYGNDKDKTVTVDCGAGSSVTIRVDTLVSATLDDLTQCESDIIERNVWHAQLKAKIAARLAPAA